MVISELDFEFYTNEDLVNPPKLEDKIVVINHMKGETFHLDNQHLKYLVIDKNKETDIFSETQEFN